MRGKLFRRSHTLRKLQTWHERDGGLRLAHDCALLNQLHPQLSYRVDPETGFVCLHGNLEYQLACNVPTWVAVRIVFPHDYPRSEPVAYDEENRFPHIADRHFYANGRCCLWLPPESSWKPSDGDALVEFVDQVALFFDRQLVCEAQPSHRHIQWPGGERAHGVTGYLEYVRDVLGGDEGAVAALVPILVGRRRIGRNRQCPCGSARKYKKCHLDRVELARRKFSVDELTKLLEFVSNPSHDSQAGQAEAI